MPHHGDRHQIHLFHPKSHDMEVEVCKRERVCETNAKRGHEPLVKSVIESGGVFCLVLDCSNAQGVHHLVVSSIYNNM